MGGGGGRSPREGGGGQLQVAARRGSGGRPGTEGGRGAGTVAAEGGVAEAGFCGEEEVDRRREVRWWRPECMDGWFVRVAGRAAEGEWGQGEEGR